MNYPYKVDMPKRQLQWFPRYTWLKDNLGQKGQRWTAKAHCFWFKDEGDLILYLLRWT
jgi:hypothetical protein